MTEHKTIFSDEVRLGYELGLTEAADQLTRIIEKRKPTSHFGVDVRRCVYDLRMKAREIALGRPS
jgi:hypothetical protein